MSLADQVVRRINRKQAELASAVAMRAGDDVKRALLDDISVLAAEFQYALYVEQQLKMIRRGASGAGASRG